MRWLVAPIYVAATIIIYFVANYPNMIERWTDTFYPRALGWAAGSAYGALRVATIMVWFSLLPAWWFATRADQYVVRVACFFAGLLIFFAPHYLNEVLMREPGYEDSRLVAVVTSLLVSLALACLPVRRETVPQ